SKSLVADAHLTKIGSFLGSPLFASPEQIRADPVDRQTDVYSVAATLYYLLTGRAPFQTGDAAATMARIVADPAPPMRGLRADPSPALDKVVLRGLERQRERRWRSLDEFRAALLPFLPGQLSVGGLGARFGAYLLDFFLVSPLVISIKLLLLGWAVGGLTQLHADDFEKEHPLTFLLNELISEGVLALYFILLEGKWHASLGK